MPIKFNQSGVMPCITVSTVCSYAKLAHRWMVNNYFRLGYSTSLGWLSTGTELVKFAGIILMSYVYQDIMVDSDDIAIKCCKEVARCVC